MVTAVDLDEGQRQRLANALQDLRPPIQLQLVIDPKVVGGIRVQIGDEVVDGTVLRKLEARAGTSPAEPATGTEQLKHHHHTTDFGSTERAGNRGEEIR